MSANVIENALTSEKEAANEELKKEMAALKKLVEKKEKTLNSNKDEKCWATLPSIFIAKI